MLYEQFADLCSREFQDDRGDVVALELSAPRLAEFSGDCAVNGPYTPTEQDGFTAVKQRATGAKVTLVTNPATGSKVAVSRLIDHVQDTATVKHGLDGTLTRTVTII